jgi:hypothetical protein
MKIKVSTVVYILLAIIVLLGLFFLLKPKQDVQAPQTSPATQAFSSTPEPNIKTFELTVKDKKLASDSSVLKVNRGDVVTLKITSDKEEELHVHAYDVSVELVPNKQAILTFSAEMSGRFPFELEKSKTELGAIEVQPK